MGCFSLSLLSLSLTHIDRDTSFKQTDNVFDKDWRRSALIRSFDLFVYYQTRPLSSLVFAIAMHMKMQKMAEKRETNYYHLMFS